MSEASVTAADRRTKTTARPRVAALALLAGLAVGCSSGGGSTSGSSGAVTLAPASTASSGAPAMPLVVDPGTGALALGAQLVRFTVRSCSLKPIIDPNGVAVVVQMSGDDGQGGAIEVSRKTTAGGQSSLPTTTDTVSYASAASNLVAQRVEVGGRVRDPLDPSANAPLLSIDGVSIRASGIFGGAAGASDLVFGELLVTCTDDALQPHTDASSSSG